MPLAATSSATPLPTRARRPAAKALPSISFASAMLLIHCAIRSAIAAGSPATRTVLARAVWPLTTSNDDCGRRHASASRAITASLALPSSGGAVTAALSAPSGSLERSPPGARLHAQIDGHARGAAPQEARIDQ